MGCKSNRKRFFFLLVFNMLGQSLRTEVSLLQRGYNGSDTENALTAAAGPCGGRKGWFPLLFGDSEN